jgi:hypothetical protein
MFAQMKSIWDMLSDSVPTNLGENMPKDQEEIIKAFNDIVQMTQE